MWRGSEANIMVRSLGKAVLMLWQRWAGPYKDFYEDHETETKAGFSFNESGVVSINRSVGKKSVHLEEEQFSRWSHQVNNAKVFCHLSKSNFHFFPFTVPSGSLPLRPLDRVVRKGEAYQDSLSRVVAWCLPSYEALCVPLIEQDIFSLWTQASGSHTARVEVVGSCPMRSCPVPSAEQSIYVL